MKVTTGLYKGRVLKTVKDLSVRPATDRVKQTIFNMVTHRMELEGASVLDLFAGSGNLGIEALSRGAGKVIFVENNADAVDYIEQNVRALRCEATTEILEADAMHFIESSSDTFDIIFADPPYRFEETAAIPERVFRRGLLNPDGYLLIEHVPTMMFKSGPIYDAGPVKKFGRTIVTFFHHHTHVDSQEPA